MGYLLNVLCKIMLGLRSIKGLLLGVVMRLSKKIHTWVYMSSQHTSTESLDKRHLSIVIYIPSKFYTINLAYRKGNALEDSGVTAGAFERTSS